MNYRYPFTPYPRGWYRLNLVNSAIRIFGKDFKFELIDSKYCLRNINNKAEILPIIKKNLSWFAFYDSEDNIPFYDIPDVLEFEHHAWQKPILLEWPNVRVHIQEVAENAVDISHFCTVHTYKDIPLITHFKTYGHQFNVLMHSRRKVLGYVCKTSMDITYYGMGIVVADVTTNIGITLKVFLTITPISIEHVDINMFVAIKKTNFFKDFIFRNLLPKDIRKEFTRDIPIWEAKTYRDKPLLCSTEGNIVRIRKWAQQFYL